ncbi:hypothetical protein [Aeromonas sp.]|uniref:hypothetical protein n=1 Tax=Aeromonas sp. TaxID=647 RepID=UPI00258BDA34|nr:hypothetical protein [Aeromonas sp.]MCX7126883.1 hypothetical protein [Aeromonas sp.]
MDNANEVIGTNEQETPFRQLPQEEQQRILDANQKRVREAPTLHEWDIRVPTPLAWIIIIIMCLFSTLFLGGGGLLLTAGEDWSGVYIMLIVSAVMTPYFRYLVMADKDYHFRLTTEGVIVTYQDAIPEVAYTIVRGVAWRGLVWWYVCSLLPCWGPVVWRSWQYFLLTLKVNYIRSSPFFIKSGLIHLAFQKDIEHCDLKVHINLYLVAPYIARLTIFPPSLPI